MALQGRMFQTVQLVCEICPPPPLKKKKKSTSCRLTLPTHPLAESTEGVTQNASTQRGDITRTFASTAQPGADSPLQSYRNTVLGSVQLPPHDVYKAASTFYSWYEGPDYAGPTYLLNRSCPCFSRVPSPPSPPPPPRRHPRHSPPFRFNFRIL